jgi:hypothetical protein
MKQFVERCEDMKTSGVFVTAKKSERLNVDIIGFHHMGNVVVVTRMKTLRDKKTQESQLENTRKA